MKRKNKKNNGKKDKKTKRRSHDGYYATAGKPYSKRGIYETLLLWAISGFLIAVAYVLIYSICPEYIYWHNLVIPVISILTAVAVALIGIMAVIIREKWIKYH